MSHLFSSCILEEMTLNLVVKVPEVEVLYALSSMQKDKSHGPDLFMVKFNSNFYDLIKLDHSFGDSGISVVRESPWLLQ